MLIPTLILSPQPHRRHEYLAARIVDDSRDAHLYHTTLPNTSLRSLNFFLARPIPPLSESPRLLLSTQFPDLSGEVIPCTQSALVSPGRFSFARPNTHAPRALFSRSRCAVLFCDHRPPPPFSRCIHPWRARISARFVKPRRLCAAA